MKTLALVVIFLTHSTGLWPHMSPHLRGQLTSSAAADTRGQKTETTSAFTPTPGPALPIQTSTTPLNISASSAAALDVSSGTLLYTKQAGLPRPIASITKLATAIVILSRHASTEIVTIPTLPAYGPADERIGLVAGETYRLDSLIQALLINSGNDAADALAIYDAGSLNAFAARMNLKMGEWGIKNIRFAGPSGLQDSGNYASAEALTRLAQLALVNPLIKSTVARSGGSITSGAGRTIPITTTNQLLASGNFYGIKTGYTPAAGECFVGLTRVNGHEVITVVLGADDRFAATMQLTDWIEHHWQWL